MSADPDTSNTSKGEEKRGPGQPRRTDWQETFLEHLSNSGSPTMATRQAVVSYKTMQAERQRNEDFALAYDAAMVSAREVTEAELLVRGRSGTPTKKTVTKLDGAGKVTEVIETETVERSTTALIAWLNANWPTKYRRNVNVEQSGTVNVKVESAIEREIDRLVQDLAVRG